MRRFATTTATAWIRSPWCSMPGVLSSDWRSTNRWASPGAEIAQRQLHAEGRLGLSQAVLRAT